MNGVIAGCTQGREQLETRKMKRGNEVKEVTRTK
jgi:hypothetical protein